MNGDSLAVRRDDDVATRVQAPERAPARVVPPAASKRVVLVGSRSVAGRASRWTDGGGGVRGLVARRGRT